MMMEQNLFLVKNTIKIQVERFVKIVNSGHMNKVLVLIFVVIIFSCNLNNKREYYETGELKSEINYLNGLKHGEEKIYYKGGKIKEINHYSDGVKSGKSTLFYESGNISEQFYYRNNSKEGKAYFFYDTSDMNLKAKINYKKGQIIGEGFFYYSLGGIKKYIYYNKLGEPAYEVNYNSKGGIQEARGTPFIDIVPITDLTFKKDKVYEIFINVAIPPYYEPVVRYGVIDTITLDFKSNYREYQLLKSDSGFIYTFKVDSPQVYTWKIDYEYDYIAGANDRMIRTLLVETDIVSGNVADPPLPLRSL